MVAGEACMRTSPSTSLRLWRLVAGGRACKSQQRGSEGLWISRGGHWVKGFNPTKVILTRGSGKAY